jgi:hypothetical protein
VCCGGPGEGDAPFPDAVAGGSGVGAAEDVGTVGAVEGCGGRLDVSQWGAPRVYSSALYGRERKYIRCGLGCSLLLSRCTHEPLHTAVNWRGRSLTPTSDASS